jgi:hypothetical protein
MYDLRENAPKPFGFCLLGSFVVVSKEDTGDFMSSLYQELVHIFKLGKPA